MLNSTIAKQLAGYLTKVSVPIEFVASVDESTKSQELIELLKQIAEMSDLVTVRVDGTSDRRPSFDIRRINSDVRVTFAGIPLGHEFTSLVLAILQVGGYPAKITDEQREQIASLSGPLDFVTYFSLSCQNCPDVVQALNTMSVINPQIRHTAIDGALFPSEVEQRNILAVPAVYLNGELFDTGRMTLDDILGKLDSSVADRQAADISRKQAFDVLIVGGGPAGAAASIYAARKGIRTGLVAERFGGQVLDTMAIENFISVSYTEGPKLAAALDAHVQEYDVDVMKQQRAVELIPAGMGHETHDVLLASGASVSAQALILAPGARWKLLNVPGEAEYRNKGVTFCPHCDGPLFKGKSVAVIGGGNSGVEAAIDLAGVVGHVTLLEFQDALLADDVLQRKARSLPNVEIIVNAATTEIVGDGNKVTGLQYMDRISGEPRALALEGVFIQIGLIPNTEWLQGSIDLTDRGEIVVDDHGRTSIPGVFAAGDATTMPYKQIVTSLGSGATAALSAFDYLIRSTAPTAQQLPVS